MCKTCSPPWMNPEVRYFDTIVLLPDYKFFNTRQIIFPCWCYITNTYSLSKTLLPLVKSIALFRIYTRWEFWSSVVNHWNTLQDPKNPMFQCRQLSHQNHREQQLIPAFNPKLLYAVIFSSFVNSSQFWWLILSRKTLVSKSSWTSPKSKFHFIVLLKGVILEVVTYMRFLPFIHSNKIVLGCIVVKIDWEYEVLKLWTRR